MGWWGPGIFDGDQPLDLYLAMVDHVDQALTGQDLTGLLTGPWDVVELPGDLDEQTRQAVAALDGIVDAVASWTASLATTPDWGSHLTTRIRASVEDGRIVGVPADPDARDAIIAMIADQMRDAAADQHDRDATIGSQVACAFLLALGLPLPDAVAVAGTAACAADPWAATNPARQQAIDQLAAAIATGSRWVAPTRSLADAVHLADAVGHTGPVNMPGST